VQYVNKVAGVILILAGGYVVWFWSTNLATGADALNDSGLFRFIEDLSRRAFAVIGDHPLSWGLGLAVTIATAVLYVIAVGHQERRDVQHEERKETATATVAADDEACRRARLKLEPYGPMGATTLEPIGCSAASKATTAQLMPSITLGPEAASGSTGRPPTGTDVSGPRHAQ
jgi:hypothetical protein